jgi:hypothetical protein
MVLMLEIASLVVCTALGLWWFRRTNLYRVHRRAGVDPGQRGDAHVDRPGGPGGPGTGGGGPAC